MGNGAHSEVTVMCKEDCPLNAFLSLDEELDAIASFVAATMGVPLTPDEERKLLLSLILERVQYIEERALRRAVPVVA